MHEQTVDEDRLFLFHAHLSWSRARKSGRNLMVSERRSRKGFLRKLDSFRKRKWIAPLTINEATLSAIKAQPRIPLSSAIDIMAFGGGKRPKDQLVIGAKRQQACYALCDAAKSSQVNLIGNPGEYGDKSESIPPTYFDMPRHLGHDDNTLETKLDDKAVEMKEYVAARAGYHQKWSHVRIETESFLAWLFPTITDPPPSSIPPRHAEILKVAKQLWPDDNIPANKGQRNKLIQEKIKPPPDERTIRRAFGGR